MNIWILNHYALSPERAGGTRHFDLAKRWVEKGHQVTIIGSGFDYMMRSNHIPDNLNYYTRSVDGVNFLWVKTRPYDSNGITRLLNMTDYGFNAWRYSSTLARPDVVIGSIVHHFAAVAAWKLAQRYRIPFILEIRDVWPDTLVDMGAFPPYHPFVLLLEGMNRLLFRRANHIICVPPFAAGRLVESGAKPANITVIPNFVDLSRSSQFLHGSASSTDRFTVMYAGMHGAANGLDTVLQAAKILQSQMSPTATVEFVLIGDGPEKPNLQQMARDMGLNNVIFRDPLPKKEIGAEMQKANAFVFHLNDLSVLAKHGISPNKLLDYMALGRPVIFACKSENNPIAEAQAGLTIPPESPDKMAEAVLTLAEMTDKRRQELGLSGRKYVTRFHNAEVAAAQFLEILQKKVDDGKGL